MSGPKDLLRVLHLEDSTYRCETLCAVPRAFVLLEDPQGRRFSRDLPWETISALGLEEGSFCRRSDLEV